jgi:hypothetical protein
MEIVYKHKETGYEITHKVIKLKLKLAEMSERVYLDCELRLFGARNNEEYPMKYVYDMRHIPFSDDFEMKVKGLFKKDELHHVLSMMDYVSGQFSFYSKHSEIRDTLQNMLIEEYYKN